MVEFNTNDKLNTIVESIKHGLANRNRVYGEVWRQFTLDELVEQACFKLKSSKLKGNSISDAERRFHDFIEGMELAVYVGVLLGEEVEKEDEERGDV